MKQKLISTISALAGFILGFFLMVSLTNFIIFKYYVKW